MASKLDTDSGKPRWFWFRWLPRGFLLAATLMPYFYYIFYYVAIEGLGPKYWNFGFATLQYGIPFLIIAVILAWVTPIIGGVFAIVVVPLVGWLWVMSHWDVHIPSSEQGWEVLRGGLVFVLLITGGILSIVWGMMRRREKHGQL